jgi:hypothetical protein
MHDENDVQLPAALPEPGFYYHYKHDPDLVRDDCPDAALRNYAYEVLPSFGLYTEEPGEYDSFQVDYLPLYPWAYVYQITQKTGRICEDHRPASMFMESVEKGGYAGPRFKRITDPDTIEALRAVADEMYGNYPKL